LEETGKSRIIISHCFPPLLLNRLCEPDFSFSSFFLGGIFFLFLSLMFLDYPPEKHHDSSSFKVGHCFFPFPFSGKKDVCSQSTHATKFEKQCEPFLSLQIDFGVRELLISTTSSRWLHMATKRSKKSLLPPRSISACMVPDRLKVRRHRIIRAR
jgi:hypothetical protein